MIFSVEIVGLFLTLPSCLLLSKFTPHLLILKSLEAFILKVHITSISTYRRTLQPRGCSINYAHHSHLCQRSHPSLSTYNPCSLFPHPTCLFILQENLLPRLPSGDFYFFPLKFPSSCLPLKGRASKKIIPPDTCMLSLESLWHWAEIRRLTLKASSRFSFVSRRRKKKKKKPRVNNNTRIQTPTNLEKQKSFASHGELCLLNARAKNPRFLIQ